MNITSYKVEVQVYGESGFYSNGLRFEKEADAIAYGNQISDRWTRVVDWRVTPTQDPPTSWVNAKAIE